jgi:hypothetical protein
MPMAANWSEGHPFATCANCGDAFETDVSYPVVTRGGGDRELELYSFCDEECRRTWEADD